MVWKCKIIKMKKYLIYYLIVFLLGDFLLMLLLSPLKESAFVELVYGRNNAPDYPFLSEVFTVLLLIPVLELIIRKVREYLKKGKAKRIKAVIVKEHTLQFWTSPRGNHLTVDNPFRGIYVQGGAGSGKSESFFKPILKQFAEMGMSGILYDFKSPELTSIAYGFYKQNPSVNFAFLDFKDVRYSNRVNPIAPRNLTKTAYAFEIAQAFIYNLMPENIKNQDFFGRSAISLTAGIIWYFKKNLPQYCTLPHVITFILKSPAERMIEIISSDNETAGMISSLKEAVDNNAGKQTAGVLGTLKNAVAQLNIKEVFYLLSADEVDLNLNSLKNPTMLAIGNDSSLPGTYEPLVSIIVTISAKLMNQKHKSPSAIILDEAPTLYIPNFEQLPATARSNKIATVYGAQDFSQLVDKYGRDKAEVMVSNLGNQFYGRTTNAKTARMISDIFDKEDRVYKNVSYGHSKSTQFFGGGSTSSNVSKSVQERQTVSVRDIKNAKPGQFYGIIAEGNYLEWLGVQLGRIESKDVVPPKLNLNVDLDKTFSKIHSDIDNLIKNARLGSEDISKSIEIEIREKVNADDILDDFFDEL